jgi:hypothetical protein
MSRHLVVLLLNFSNVIILPNCFEDIFWNEPLEAGSLGLILVTFTSI